MSQSIAIMILGNPQSNDALTALNFAKSVLSQGNSIYRLFFYHEAVLHGSTLSINSQDEKNLSREWQSFVSNHELDAVICITSGLKRGIVNKTESDRYDLTQHNLNKDMALSGLGQWIEAVKKADKYVVFGA